jgi:hypothetical protein
VRALKGNLQKNPDTTKASVKFLLEGKIDDESEHSQFIKSHAPRFLDLPESFFSAGKIDDFPKVSFFDLTISKAKEKHADTEIYKNIVEKGIENNESIMGSIPYIHYRNLLSCEPREIERYRILLNLMINYLGEKEDVPLSICVFGSPGSGKSFGVKEILGYVKENKLVKNARPETIEFNLSQMSSVEALHSAFHKAADLCVSGKTPVVFWDEFDSDCGDRKYGWLKYFLAPMQDGEYFDGNTYHKTGKSIYVFAGSKVHSWKQFLEAAGIEPSFSIKGKARENDPTNTKKKDMEKGIDFISRVAAYVDIKGPNRLHESETHEGETQEMCALRRAILLRSFFQKYLKDNINGLDIDERLLKALLFVDKYKHGSRSLEKLVNQLVINSKNSPKIQLRSIPSQLDIYCDQGSFQYPIDVASDILDDSPLEAPVSELSSTSAPVSQLPDSFFDT